MRDTSFVVSPIRDHAFFEQPQGERLLGDYLLQLLCLTAQVLDLLRAGRSCRIPGKPALACLKELLRPAVVQALGNPLAPAQLGNAGFAANPVQHDSDLVFSRIVLARRAADVLYKLFGRPVRCPGFLSHLRSLNGYDEPEILLSSPHRFCPMSADAGQSSSRDGAGPFVPAMTSRNSSCRPRTMPPSFATSRVFSASHAISCSATRS